MTSTDICKKKWHSLTPLWQGGKEIIDRGLSPSQLSPIWQMLLLGDGSPTRHLQLLTNEKVIVDLIAMSDIGMSTDNAPEQIELLPGPRIRRQVWLCTASGQRLAYAASWWQAALVNEYLQNKNLSIWSSLITQRKELYREVLGIRYGKSAALESAFDHESNLWGRHYLFWNQAKPLTLIYEIFSPSLRKYIGPETFKPQESSPTK